MCPPRRAGNLGARRLLSSIHPLGMYRLFYLNRKHQCKKMRKGEEMSRERKLEYHQIFEVMLYSRKKDRATFKIL